MLIRPFNHYGYIRVKKGREEEEEEEEDDDDDEDDDINTTICFAGGSAKFYNILKQGTNNFFSGDKHLFVVVVLFVFSAPSKKQ